MPRRAPRKPWTINSFLNTNPLLIIFLTFLEWFLAYSKQVEENHFQGLERMRIFVGQSPTLRDDDGDYNKHKARCREILKELGF